MKTKLPFHKSSWQAEESQYFYENVDLKLWPLSDRKKVMNSLAADYWSDINEESILVNSPITSIVWYDCAGHGGFVMFSEVKLPEEMSGRLVASSADYDYTFPKAWYFYLFEEDCAWSSLFICLNYKLQMAMVKHWWSTPSSYAEAKTWEEVHREVLKSAHASAKRWNPDFYNKVKWTHDVDKIREIEASKRGWLSGQPGVALALRPAGI